MPATRGWPAACPSICPAVQHRLPLSPSTHIVMAALDTVLHRRLCTDWMVPRQLLKKAVSRLAGPHDEHAWPPQPLHTIPK